MVQFNIVDIFVVEQSSSSSSSSCHAASMDLHDPLLSSVSIVHRSQEVLQVISCISTELLHIGSSWSSKLCSSMWRGPHEYTAYNFVLTFLACLVRLTLIDLVMCGRWPYSCCFVGLCFQDLFITVVVLFVGGIKSAISFLRVLENIIARVEFDLASYDVTIQHTSNYTT